MKILGTRKQWTADMGDTDRTKRIKSLMRSQTMTQLAHLRPQSSQMTTVSPSQLSTYLTGVAMAMDGPPDWLSHEMDFCLLGVILASNPKPQKPKRVGQAEIEAVEVYPRMTKKEKSEGRGTL